MKPNHITLAPHSLSFALAVLVVAQFAQGANSTWNGNTDSNWNTPANWNEGAWASGSTAVFGAAGTSGTLLNNDVAAGTSVAGITFNSGASAFVIGDGTTTANAGNSFVLTSNVVNSSASLETINAPFSMTAARTFTTSAGGGDILLAGNLSGTGGAITKAGPGTLKLAGASSFTGALTIQGGTLGVDAGAGGSLYGTSPYSGLLIGTSTGGRGTFVYDNTTAAGAVAQNLGAFSYNSGFGDQTVQLDRTALQTVGLTFASLPTNNIGSSVNFVFGGTPGVNGTDSKIVITGQAAGFLSGTTKDYRFFNGGDFVWYDAGGFIRGINYGSDASTATSGGTVFTGGSGVHQEVTGTIASQSGVTLKTLKIKGASDITVPTGTLNVTSGADTGAAVLKTGGGTATIYGNFKLDIQGAGCIRTDTASDTLIINSGIASAGDKMRLVKSGEGTLILKGTSSWGSGVSGGVSDDYINAGILELGGAGTMFSGNNMHIASGGLFWYNSSAAQSLIKVISGNGGITVSAGTLTLSGVNTYTGATSVNAGSLVLDKSGTGALAATTALNLAGTFTIKGKTTGATTQTLGNLTLNGGAGTIFLDPNNGTSTILTLGNAWSRNAGSTLLIDYSSANTGTRQIVTAAATTGLMPGNGIYGSVLVKDAAGITGFATRAAGSSMPITRYDDTTGTTLAEASDDATLNFTTLGTTYTGGTLNWTNGGSLANRSVNSLTIDTSINSGTIDLGAPSNILSLASGAILFKGGKAETLAGGQIGAAGSEVLIHQTGSGTLTINSQISSGAGWLAKTGSGELVLGASNTFTGGTVISAGTLTLASATDTLSNTGAVTVDGTTATLALGANSDTVGAVTLKNGGAIIGSGGVLTGSSYAVESGAVSAILGGGASLTKTTPGTVILSGSNTYTGNTTVSAGVLSLTNACLADTSTVTIASGAKLDLNTAGASDTIAALVLNGTSVPEGTYNSSTPTYGIYFTGTGSLVVPSVPSAYANWAKTHITDIKPTADATPTGDPDGDGVNNLAEFAFNGDPLSATNSGQIYGLTADSDFDTPDTAKELILTLAVRKATPAFTAGAPAIATSATDGITYRIEGSLDLTTFGQTVNPVGLIDPGVPLTDPINYEYRSFSLRIRAKITWTFGDFLSIINLV